MDPKPRVGISDYSTFDGNPISNSDPNGDCPNCLLAAIGAGVGAIVGGAIEAGSQLYKDGKVSNWKAVGGSALQGAITGGVAGLTGGTSLLVTTSALGVANGVGGAVNRAVQGKAITTRSVITDVAVGAAFGFVGNKLGQAFNKAAPTVDDIFTSSLSSRGLAEKLAQVTKYKGFQNANEVLKKNNPTYDLFDKVGNVVDITTTSAQKLSATQFTNKLEALGNLGSQAQKKLLDSTTYYQILNVTRDSVDKETSQTTRLVSEYTFRKLVRNDFSLLLTGDKNKTTLGRYASLEINKDEQKVSVTPITIVSHNDPLKGPFYLMQSLDLSAVNSKNIFNFENRKKVSAGYSITKIWSGSSFDTCHSQTKTLIYFTRKCNPKPDTLLYKRIHKTIYDDFKKKYNGMATATDTLDISKFAADNNDLQKAYLEKINEYENQLTKDKWNAKWFFWIKANLNILSWDILDILGINDSTTYIAPKNKAVYNPSFQLSLNYYRAFKRYGNIYFNIWSRIGKKHSLSEIASASEWKKISSFGDSSFVINDSKDVYVLANTNINTKWRPDYGAQFIYLLPAIWWVKNFSPGIDISTSWNGFINSMDNSNAFTNITSIGIILPLKDKDGESTINIEPFFQRKMFINYNKDSKNTWGIRFSLPFTKLF